MKIGLHIEMETNISLFINFCFFKPLHVLYSFHKLLLFRGLNVLNDASSKIGSIDVVIFNWKHKELELKKLLDHCPSKLN